MTHPGPIAIVPAAAAVLAALVGVCHAAPWAMPRIALPKDAEHPLLACTLAERGRLRAAYKAKGPEHKVVASVVSQADAILGREVTFPPRGGQHNQWYQCDKCQLALKTLSDTRHRCPRCPIAPTPKTTPSNHPHPQPHHHSNPLTNGPPPNSLPRR